MSWSEIARERLIRYREQYHYTNTEIIALLIKQSANDNWNPLVRKRMAKKIGREERRNK